MMNKSGLKILFLLIATLVILFNSGCEENTNNTLMSSDWTGKVRVIRIDYEGAPDYTGNSTPFRFKINDLVQGIPSDTFDESNIVISAKGLKIASDDSIEGMAVIDWDVVKDGGDYFVDFKVMDESGVPYGSNYLPWNGRKVNLKGYAMYFNDYTTASYAGP